MAGKEGSRLGNFLPLWSSVLQLIPPIDWNQLENKKYIVMSTSWSPEVNVQTMGRQM